MNTAKTAIDIPMEKSVSTKKRKRQVKKEAVFVSVKVGDWSKECAGPLESLTREMLFAGFPVRGCCLDGQTVDLLWESATKYAEFLNILSGHESTEKPLCPCI